MRFKKDLIPDDPFLFINGSRTPSNALVLEGYAISLCLNPPSKVRFRRLYRETNEFLQVLDPWLVWLILWNGNPISRRSGAPSPGESRDQSLLKSEVG